MNNTKLLEKNLPVYQRISPFWSLSYVVTHQVYLIIQALNAEASQSMK